MSIRQPIPTLQTPTGWLRQPMRTQEFREVAKQYPMIQAEEMIVDNTCMQLVSKPHQFDVMVRVTCQGSTLPPAGDP